MTIILQIIGYGWALLGVINFVSVNNIGGQSNLVTSVSLMSHLAIYGPGLLFGALGTIAMQIKGRVKGAAGND